MMGIITTPASVGGKSESPFPKQKIQNTLCQYRIHKYRCKQAQTLQRWIWLWTQCSIRHVRRFTTGWAGEFPYMKPTIPTKAMMLIRMLLLSNQSSDSPLSSKYCNWIPAQQCDTDIVNFHGVLLLSITFLLVDKRRKQGGYNTDGNVHGNIFGQGSALSGNRRQ